MEMLIAPWSGITLKEMRHSQKLSSARTSIIARRGRKSSGIETILSPNWVTKSAISRMIPLRVVLVMPLCFSFVRSQFMSDLGQIASHVGMDITLSHRLYAKTSSDARTHNKNHLFISVCPFSTYVCIAIGMMIHRLYYRGPDVYQWRRNDTCSMATSDI